MLSLGKEIILTVLKSTTHNGYSTHALDLTVLKITAKAVNFSIDNTTYNLWFPLSAIEIKEDDGIFDYSVKSWFSYSSFAEWAISKFSTFYDIA